MKNILLAVTCTFLFNISFSQQPDLNRYNEKRQNINKNGLLVIGSWAAGNIIYGSIASSQAVGSNKYFHRMNALWNSATLALSTFGYLAANKNKQLSYYQSIKEQSLVEKLFLVNTGIDVAYIVSGFYLREKSKNSLNNSNKLRGYGESVIFQGSVLLLFDAMLFKIHSHHGKQLYKMIDHFTLSTATDGLGIIIKL
ncbi:MAG: hypothetical protein ABIO05_07945 [Ferruginibacter sp.]